MATCSGGTGAHRSRTIAIALAFGPTSDPFVQVNSRIIMQWLRIWMQARIPRWKLRRAWRRAVLRVLPDGLDGGIHWPAVVGPLSAAIASLSSLGWQPAFPEFWVDHKGSQWAMDPNVDEAQFRKVIGDAALDVLASSLATGWNGSGLSEGVDWDLTLPLHSKFRKDCHQELGLLECIMAGGFWTDFRRASASSAAAPVHCPWCGQVVTSDFHYYWDCYAASDMDIAAIKESNDLAGQAAAGQDSQTCLWLRGLVPVGMAPMASPFPAEDTLSFLHGCSSWDPGVYYTDASGGDWSAFPRLRRVGIGVVRLAWGNDPVPSLLLAAWGPVAGNCQTVVRGELLAILQVLRHVASGAVTVKTDSEVNQLLFLKMVSNPTEFHPEANKDLWEEMQYRFKDYVDNGGTFMVEWVKGHATVTHLQQGVISEADLWGNFVADALAGHAAQTCKPLLSDCLTYTWTLNTTRRVQLRLLAIACELGKEWEKHKKAEVARLRARSSQQVLQDQLAVAARARISEHGARVLSSHTLVCIDGQYWCTQCCRWQPKTASRQWLAIGCKPLPDMSRVFNIASLSAPRRLPADRLPYRIGQAVFHDSHTLFVFRGLVFCRRCGAYAATRPVKLLDSCMEPSTSAKGTLTRILNQKFPSSVMKAWPDQVIAAGGCKIILD